MKTKKKPTTSGPVMHRQGDVLFVKVEALPDDVILHKSDVIVEGEVTGHAHRLSQGRILEATEGRLFLEILDTSKESEVVHEEHHPVKLEPGYWEVVRQREYSPEAVRMVID